jgi:hypothetical protein
MKINEAIEILENHNKWRCDNSVPSRHESTDPKKLTAAINTVISELKTDLLNRVNDCLCSECKGVSLDDEDAVYCPNCAELQHRSTLHFVN